MGWGRRKISLSAKRIQYDEKYMIVNIILWSCHILHVKTHGQSNSQRRLKFLNREMPNIMFSKGLIGSISSQNGEKYQTSKLCSCCSDGGG